MADRYFRGEFLFSFFKNLTSLCGFINIVQQVKAAVTTQGLTLTAVAFGTSGNAITVAFTGGATAGAEVVTVTGNAISVQIQSGVSTVTQVRTALQAAAAATALVVTTGTSASTVATAAAVPLAGGIDGVASFDIPGVATCKQTGVGEFTLTLADAYPNSSNTGNSALKWVNFHILSATAQNLVPQLKSMDVLTAKTIVVRLLASGTATDPTSALTLYFNAFLRNSQT